MKGIIYPRPYHPNDLTYYYDSEKEGVIDGHPYKGVVTAVKEIDSREFFSRIDNVLYNDKNHSGIFSEMWYSFGFRAEMRNETIFKATAYCAIDDAFDLKTGRDLARFKCLDKYNRAYLQYCNKLYEQLDNVLCAIFKEINKRGYLF